jgi:hypothetical protein
MQVAYRMRGMDNHKPDKFERKRAIIFSCAVVLIYNPIAKKCLDAICPTQHSVADRPMRFL